MSGPSPDVLVIGAGVSGLTTAVCLAESGASVIVAAADPPQRTTSAAAGAIWGPHLVGRDERVTRWGQVTMSKLTELAGDPATGVRLASGVAASAEPAGEPPDWVASASRADPAGLPAGYVSGWRLTAPVASMPVYLGYLQHRLEQAGGTLREARFSSLAEAAAATRAPVIVNCAGAAARDIVPDPDVVPVRGQVVVVANPGIGEFFVGTGSEPGEVSYFFPHGDVVVLGGTEETGNASREPDPATAADIVRRCAAAEPRLGAAAVLGHRVGLRPWRPGVRLDLASLDGGRRVLHNYGHGGAGVTLSWGCALDAAAMVLR